MKIKILINFIFPLLAITSISLSILTIVKINNLEKSQDKLKRLLFSHTDDRIEAETKEPQATIQSDTETQKIFEQKNEDLKKRSIVISPNKIRTAYFQEKFTTDNVTNIGDFDYISVVIEDGNKTQVVFQNDFRLSNLEWLNDREIVVYRSCGTECMIAYIVDTDTKHQQELILGVGYTWSPNKQYVAVYHYSYKYGISIANRGNQYGQTVLQVRRDHPNVGSALTSQTKVAWSSDSTKLAVVIRKENEEKLELIIYDITNQFKILYQQDLIESDISNLTWEGLNTVIVTGNRTNKKITF